MHDANLPFHLGLAGPTAAGKTAAALAIARRWPCEIISVDSALVYRHMDIGTAKPSAEELALVPHHLINTLDPTQSYSAAEFVRDTQRLVHAIAARGRLPLLVGGTMLYFKALMDGIDAMPAADPIIRAAIDTEATQVGWPAMHDQLMQVDPQTGARLSPNDSQRIQRALEVFRASGKPLSAFHSREAPTVGRTSPEDNARRMPLVSLEPDDRAWLHARIAERFDAMLAAGLIDEVQTLRARGDLHLGLPSMRCVGYRQTWEMLDGTLPAAELRDRGIQATRQLAKRQITWLRSMPHRIGIACDAPDALEQVLKQVESTLMQAGWSA